MTNKERMLEIGRIQDFLDKNNFDYYVITSWDNGAIKVNFSFECIEIIHLKEIFEFDTEISNLYEIVTNKICELMESEGLISDKS